MSTFQELRIVDNFYQTSLFYPMPAVLVSTLTDEGKTTCGPYSLLSPFYVAGKPFYAFMLECRNSSNTAQNLIKHKRCVINFLPDDRKTFKEMVRLGWPGDTPAEKMKDFRFHLEDGLRKAEDPEGTYPQVITEAVQAVECTWVDTLDNAQDDTPIPEGMDHYDLPKHHDFNGITTPYGAHFVLKIDKILMKEQSTGSSPGTSPTSLWTTAIGTPKTSGTTSTVGSCRSCCPSARPPWPASATPPTGSRPRSSSRTRLSRSW